MATRKPKEKDASLPFDALHLLAPPVRLVSAALWKVMKQRDVMQYGVVEEFVTSACETVPGLLTARHQGKLALGLRGRLILELCCKQPDEEVIRTHLGRIRAPAGLSAPSAPAAFVSQKRDVKILRTVESFHSLVHALLTDPAERQRFFKEDFPVDYGSTFDQELEKLLWEFLIRLDQLLPVPNLAQTVAWLSDSPPVLEECAQAATQPQLLKVLLQHQACLGHLETAASLPPNMGDSILDSLSLPPSGRVSSSKGAGAKMSDPSGGAQTPFITPVMGIISNEDVPIMTMIKRRTLRGDSVATENFTSVKERQIPKEGGEQVGEERSASQRSGGVKRKQPDEGESSEEVGRLGQMRSGKKRINLANSASGLRRGEGDRRASGSREDGAKPVGGGACDRRALETCMTELGVKALRLPEDPILCSTLVSCLCSQPRVVLEKLSLTSSGANRRGRGGKRPSQRRKSPVKAPARGSNRPQTPGSDFPGLDDKENRPVLPSVSSSPSRRRSNTESSAPPGDSEDYVADSEDEATKNFKGRLFTKRYYKTKHGTYVPTLREYWKPGVMRRDLSACGKRR